MSDWVDYAEIKKNVSMEKVLAHYKINNLKQKGPNKLMGPCPIHGGDNANAFHVDLSKGDGGAWKCFTGCDKGGNAIDFVAAMERVTFRDAALRLQRWFLRRKQPRLRRPGPPLGLLLQSRGKAELATKKRSLNLPKKSRRALIRPWPLPSKSRRIIRT